MYDQREKAQRDHQWLMEGATKQARQEGFEEGRTEGRTEGHVEGRAEGRAEGELAGKIQIIQELLGDEQSTSEDLLKNSMEDLSALLDELQQRLRTRSS